MTDDHIDPVVRDGLQRVINSAVPGADAEARILMSVRDSATGAGSQHRLASLRIGRPLRAVALAILTAAVVAGSVVIGFAVLARRAPSPVHLPPVSATATPTPSAVPTASAPPPSPSASPAAAQLVSRFVRVGDVGAIVLGPNSVYVICNENEPAGTYSPAVAHVVRIDRGNGAIHDGGLFPGAGSLAVADGYLWVASGPSPGVPSRDANILYRLNALTLVVQQRTSIAGLTIAGNFEPPALAAAGNVLWIGYGPQVARLSAASGAVVWSRSLGGTGSVSSLSVDPTGRLIYAGFDAARPSIAELNATTGATVASTSAYYGFDLGGPKLAAFVGDVWVAYATGMDGTNVELGASDLKPRVEGAGNLHTNGLNVFRGNGFLWMSDVGELFCADQTTGAVRATIADVPFGTLIASNSAGTVVAGSNGVYFLKADPRC